MYLWFKDDGFSTANPDSEKKMVGITTIFISNNNSILGEIKHETKSRIRFVIRFNDYTISDIYQILKYIATFSLNPSKNYDSEIKTVAVEIGDTTHSIRDAKNLLINFLKTKNIENAYSEVEKNWIKEDMKNLGLHEKLFLYSIVKKHSNIISMQNSPNKREYGNQIYPTIGSIYHIYKDICARIEKEPKSIKTFSRILSYLETMKLVMLNVKGMGRGKGRTMLIYLASDFELVKPIIFNEVEGFLNSDE
jgi:Cdc6-like AAA superfamily ATPase